VSRTRSRRSAASMRRALGALGALGALAGCGRSCGANEPPAGNTTRVEPAPLSAEAARCRAELSHGAVAVASGAGAIDALFASCDERSPPSLRAWVLRGHTLSTTRRSLEAGSTWSVSSSISTGVEGLAAVGAHGGPLAWRAPTALLEGLEDLGADEWWTARSASPDGPWTRASVAFARSVRSRGILGAIERPPDAATLIGSVLEDGREQPRVVLVPVTFGRSEAERLARVPDSAVLGEVRAWAPGARVALVERADGASERVYIEPYVVDGERLVARGSHALASRHVLVPSLGASLGREAFFALSSFERVRGATSCSDEGEGLLTVGDGLCVRPGPVLLARVTAEGLSMREVARAGLVDAVAVEADGAATVLYVAAERGAPSQRAARVTRDGAVQSWALRARGLPPIDRPTLVSCGGELWIVGEARVAAGDGDESERSRRDAESAVMAVPLRCTR
jgi:hypothetical protein